LTNLLEIEPALRRQLRLYVAEDDTESKLAAYLADGVQALMYRWDRTYSVSKTGVETYLVDPDIEQKDIRPIVLMASIIYKMANSPLAAFQDGDFSYNPHKGAASALEIDRDELKNYIGAVRLAKAVSGPLMGYGYVFNTESYARWLAGGWIMGGWV